MNSSSKNMILLVEDDLNLGIILKEYLEVKNYTVTHCLNGDEGIKIFKQGKYDLCLLDVMMPHKDGFTLAREIRQRDDQIPIIFLTAKSLQTDKIEGFKIGADDYVTKPFSAEELLLRIAAVLKRTQSSKIHDNTLSQFVIGKYIFDSVKQLLTIEDYEQKLTSKENELLKLLCLYGSEVLERSVALNKIWKDDTYFNSRSMDVYITKLRNYLKKDETVEIVNVHGQGYKLLSTETKKIL